MLSPVPVPRVTSSLGASRDEFWYRYGDSNPDPVAVGDAERENGHVLLVFEVGVHRDQGVDHAAGALQQCAVLGSRPTKAMDCRYRVPDKGIDQVARKV